MNVVTLPPQPVDHWAREVVARHGPGEFPVVSEPGRCDCGRDPSDPQGRCRPGCASQVRVIKTPSGPRPVSVR